MSLTSDLRCPRASLETEARAKLSEEDSEYVSGLVVTEARRSGLLPAERRLLFRGPSQEVFSLTPLYSQASFFWSLSPILFVLSRRKRTKTKYPCRFAQRPLCSRSASAKHPDLAGLPPRSHAFRQNRAWVSCWLDKGNDSRLTGWV